MAELNRKVSVCPTHGRLLRIQIERNENVAQGRADFDRKELARRLGA